MRLTQCTRWRLFKPKDWLTNALAAVAACALLSIFFYGSIAAQALTKSGTISIRQTQIAFIGSANLGGGTLKFNGRSYSFKIGGLGVGGIGLSKIKATGNIYNLRDIAYFPGAYVQGRFGAVIGDVSTGKLWLKNSNGVVIELKAERKGLALSLGGDAIYIDLN